MGDKAKDVLFEFFLILFEDLSILVAIWGILEFSKMISVKATKGMEEVLERFALVNL